MADESLICICRPYNRTKGGKPCPIDHSTPPYTRLPDGTMEWKPWYVATSELEDAEEAARAKKHEDEAPLRAHAREVFGTYVYFIECGPRGPIKIGHAAHPGQRLAGLQGSNPIPLRIVRLLYGGRERERILHKKFAKTRLNGEWFRRTKRLLAYIATAEADDYSVYGDHYLGNFYTEPTVVLTKDLQALIFTALPMTPRRGRTPEAVATTDGSMPVTL